MWLTHPHVHAYAHLCACVRACGCAWHDVGRCTLNEHGDAGDRCESRRQIRPDSDEHDAEENAKYGWPISFARSVRMVIVLAICCALECGREDAPIVTISGWLYRTNCALYVELVLPRGEGFHQWTPTASREDCVSLSLSLLDYVSSRARDKHVSGWLRRAFVTVCYWHTATSIVFDFATSQLFIARWRVANSRRNAAANRAHRRSYIGAIVDSALSNRTCGDFVIAYPINIQYTNATVRSCDRTNGTMFNQMTIWDYSRVLGDNRRKISLRGHESDVRASRS